MNLVVQILKPSREKSTLHGGGEPTTRGSAYYTGRSILHWGEHTTRGGALYAEGSTLHGEVYTTQEGAYYTWESIVHEEEHITRKGAYYTGDEYTIGRGACYTGRIILRW